MNTAIVRGLCSIPSEMAAHLFALPLLLSPRGAKNARKLYEELGEGGKRIKICASNAEVVDESDWLLLGILPKHADTLKGLPFRPEQTLVNLMSTVNQTQLSALAGGVVPMEQIIYVVPIPPVAIRSGTTLICPKGHTELRALFEGLGTVVEVETVDTLRVLQASTAMMGTPTRSYYVY